MAATDAFPPTQDLPFSVQDRRKKGFFTIDNDLLDHHGAELGPYGLSVYMALARFANQDSECFPSQSTIAKRTGMSRMQVSREIDKLKQNGLVVVEQQFGPKGEKRSNLYILLDPPHVTDSYNPDNRELQPHVTDSYNPSNGQLHKQNIENKTRSNKTQTTTALVNKGGNNSGSEPESSAVVVALTLQGLSAKVVQRFANRYEQARIDEKLEYLAFLQEEDPDKVQNPRGWLRRAIEEDYGPPDGFVSREERERLAAEEEQLAQEEAARARAAEEERQALQEKIRAEHQASILQARQEHGTTEEDLTFWEKAQKELKLTLVSDIADLATDAHILKRKGDAVVIGVTSEEQWRRFQHPGTKKVIQKALSRVAGQDLVLETQMLEGVVS